MKGNKSLSQINTAPVTTVFSIDTPTQTEPSYICEKILGQEHNHVRSTRTSFTKMCTLSSFLNLNLYCFIMALVTTAFCLMYVLCKTQISGLFFYQLENHC
jgi:hypothetical protein